MNTDAYMNGQPVRSYGPPSQGYPQMGMVPGQGAMGQPQGQNMPQRQWQPGAAVRPPGMKPMPPNIQNGTTGVFPPSSSSGDSGGFNHPPGPGQPPGPGSMHPGYQMYQQPTSGGPNQPNQMMPPGAGLGPVRPPPLNAGPRMQMPPQSAGQLPQSMPHDGSHQPLENRMESMNLSGEERSWQPGPPSMPSNMQAPYQPRPGPPQNWAPQTNQRPAGMAPPSGRVGQLNFPAAPPPQMYSVPPAQGSAGPLPAAEQQFNAYAGPPPPSGPPGQMPPPSMANQSQGPPQRPMMPVNPGPQTMMQMGYSSPSDSPTPQFPGQMQPNLSGGMQNYPGPNQAGHLPGPPQQQYNYGGPPGKLAQPMPGQPPLGGPMAQPPMSQPPPRRLDPDQMPSPIQVMDDDRKNRSGIFQTGQKGTLPPLVTTNFVVEDQGMCSPRYLRSTMYNVPCTNDILKQTHLPFAITLMPFAQISDQEQPLPVVDLGQVGPVRCNRCKAYMSPYMVFTDGGRKFQCSFCTCNTEVPPEYFNHLDHTGRRIDCYDRPELCLGAYEFVATADYCKDGKLPAAPAYIFMIDVSYQSVKSGLVNLLCTRLKDLLAHLPKDAEDAESEIRVGFVTYSNVLHFYNIKGALAQPQMLVVSDVQDVFVPLLDGFLVKLSECDAMIDMLMSQIAQMFSDSRQTEVVLGPVIQAGLDALRSANRAGKLFIFHSSLPSAEAPGKLKGRDDRNLLGTDKEKTILSPQTNFYTKLGQECVAAGCSVDLFLFPNSYIDIATVSEVCRLTGGNVHKYSYFQADLGGDMLIDDLQYAITQPAAFDAVIRVRTSTGIRAVDFYGNFLMSNTTDVEMACVGTDSALSVEIKHDDKLSEADGAFVQAAVLYTSVGGRRRLRVLNTAFNTCMQIADMFRSCELDTFINYMAKHGIRECLNTSSRQVRENLIQQCAQVLACYRKNCASPSSAGQLILPECMKLLPLYINCVIKAGILQAGDITTDDRSYEMHLVNAMDVTATNAYFYPQLIPIHELDVDSDSIPSSIRCSYERLQDNGVYLLDNGLILFMWIGLSTSVDWIRNVLGVASIAQVDIDKTRLQELDNPLSQRVRAIIQSIRAKRQRHMKLVIIRQRDKLEPVFLHYLMEDRGTGGSSSYVDFLCHIHKEIRNLLS